MDFSDTPIIGWLSREIYHKRLILAFVYLLSPHILAKIPIQTKDLNQNNINSNRLRSTFCTQFSSPYLERIKKKLKYPFTIASNYKYIYFRYIYVHPFYMSVCE